MRSPPQPFPKLPQMGGSIRSAELVMRERAVSNGVGFRHLNDFHKAAFPREQARGRRSPYHHDGRFRCHPRRYPVFPIQQHHFLHKRLPPLYSALFKESTMETFFRRRHQEIDQHGKSERSKGRKHIADGINIPAEHHDFHLGGRHDKCVRPDS